MDLKNHLQSFNLLTDVEIDDFIQQTSTKIIKKGDFFIKEGVISKEVGFINKGFFRSYYYNSNEEEVTYCFRFEKTFISAYTSLLSQQPSVENIQALTDVELNIIPRDLMIHLEKSNVNWLRLFKYFTEQEYMEMEKRIFLLQKETAEKKYEDLLIHHPEYLQKIPLNYLASYLGITQRHLSRIRNSMSI
ncbi:cyclic nucleotide-binding domain-containing protein [Flammeovirga yaeyamensis]|uniref:Cyclic nucleotide-binding domain-containing protein n=1 Tax=Flammeovirga yaeyamensis TaxID=367791 RepID=A0AAX1N7C8_9BACT|nr:Crp/Fnr family transcriptional regulator [Flammeovirga yaeyamensis]MBB3697714.1 CRP-like cAMP-binding protein [Flammeovirga yaeyamensis]NMF35928.1 Crp/Fnr family transcriptional regulator [Flammeovirga yaeyamensis]QWG03122.1 cyclic nucleotide-binding domain-containing protein [Flammeovirga yaeyamensis]